MKRTRGAVRWMAMLLMLPLAAGSARPAEAAPLKVGESVPALRVSGEGGAEIRLEGLRDKVVLINFWATWCAPCLRELPLLERLHRELSGQGVAVLAINVDEERATAGGVVKHLELTMPVAYDPQSRAVERFGPRTLPATYILDRRGSVRFIHEGVIDEADLSRIKAQLLAAQ